MSLKISFYGQFYIPYLLSLIIPKHQYSTHSHVIEINLNSYYITIITRFNPKKYATYRVQNPTDIHQYSVHQAHVFAMGKMSCHILYLQPHHLICSHRQWPLSRDHRTIGNKAPGLLRLKFIRNVKKGTLWSVIDFVYATQQKFVVQNDKSTKEHIDTSNAYLYFMT